MNSLPPITSAFLNVTNSCNLACKYCFVEQHPNFMTFGVARDTVDFLIENSKQSHAVPSITFFGGEPMLCWDTVVKPLIDYVRKERNVQFGFSMTTNGTLLTGEIISYLHDNKVDIMMSIDGAEKTQNFNRPFHDGGGSFNAIFKNIKLLLSSNPNMTFRSTLIPETCKHIYENIKFAEGCGYTNFFIIPNVFQRWSRGERLVAEQEFHRYTTYLITSFKSGHMPIRCSPLEDGFKRIIEINSAVASGQRVGCKTAHNKCGLGAALFGSVDYRGNIYACQEMASCKGEGDLFYIGSIYSGVDDDKRHTLMKKFDTRELFGEDCPTCTLRTICDGGCVANNYLWGGNVNHVPPDYCWWMKLMLSEAANIMNVLGTEKNELFKTYWDSLHNVGWCTCKK